MARFLLFFPILRTRSARKKLVAGSVIVLLASLGGCADDPPRWWSELVERFSSGSNEDKATSGGQEELPSRRPDDPSRHAQELEALETEAGIERGHDPAAPGGDLQRDLAEFTTLDACVHAHRVTDPVLADAIDALGYDTLVRDACRILQALKSKDGKFCQPIAATSLRQRCESQVAILAGAPALCPLVAATSAMQVREPVCLARASRDERLCAAAVESDRTACRALVRGHSSDCGSDAACVRQVDRFRALLERPAKHEPFPVRLHVEFATERGKLETVEGTFDLDDVAAAGAVARPMGDKVRFMIGTPKTAAWPAWDSSAALPRIFLALSVPAKLKSLPAEKADAATGLSLGASDLTFYLLIPRVALIDATLASDRHAVIQEASASTSSPLRLTLTAKVNDSTRIFRIKIELETFVRDGVALRPAGKKGP